jgi:SAM-dependent methyltransferase
MTAPPQIFDHRVRDRMRARAYRAGVAGADFLLTAAAADLAERLETVNRRFAMALDLGSANNDLARALVEGGAVDRVVRLDRLPESGADIIADQDILPLRPRSLELVVSALALHWSDDLPGTLAQIKQSLQQDGLFVGTLLGGDTLIELRDSLALAETEITGGASPRIIPFADLRALGALLQRAGFALPVIDRDRMTVRYSTVRDLMLDLRAMGATNPLRERSRRPLSRAILARCQEIYAARFSDPDGRIRVTFDMFSVSGWSPHHSQQKPLKPGEAKTRLADALGTQEISAGDKAGHSRSDGPRSGGPRSGGPRSDDSRSND